MAEKIECHLDSAAINTCQAGEFCNLVDSRIRREEIMHDITGETFRGFCAFCDYDKQEKPKCNFSHRRVTLLKFDIIILIQ